MCSVFSSKIFILHYWGISTTLLAHRSVILKVRKVLESTGYQKGKDLCFLGFFFGLVSLRDTRPFSAQSSSTSKLMQFDVLDLYDTT